LEEGSEVLYEITPAFVPDAARGLAHDDPAMGIDWPLPNPVLSAADQGRPRLVDAETFA
jgi:dTDP-4-dehydrorhamnose 3,5-epimerase